jgi:hypothetical protein
MHIQVLREEVGRLSVGITQEGKMSSFDGLRWGKGIEEFVRQVATGVPECGTRLTFHNRVGGTFDLQPAIEPSPTLQWSPNSGFALSGTLDNVSCIEQVRNVAPGQKLIQELSPDPEGPIGALIRFALDDRIEFALLYSYAASSAERQTLLLKKSGGRYLGAWLLLGLCV